MNFVHSTRVKPFFSALWGPRDLEKPGPEKTGPDQPEPTTPQVGTNKQPNPTHTPKPKPVRTTQVAFNIYNTPPLGVFPAKPHASADTYDLLMNQETGPQKIPFNHVNSHDETVVMLDGGYTMRVGTQKVVVNKGDVLIIPAGVSHGDVETQSGYRVLQLENNQY